MPVSSASKTSSLDFALRPPDAGQLAIDERVRASSPSERAEFAYRLRQQAFVVVNQAADEAGPMSELDRAVFVLPSLPGVLRGAGGVQPRGTRTPRGGCPTVIMKA